MGDSAIYFVAIEGAQVTQIKRKERKEGCEKCDFAFKLLEIKLNWYCFMEPLAILRNDHRLPPSKSS
jgi:hypothetical protein